MQLLIEKILVRGTQYSIFLICKAESLIVFQPLNSTLHRDFHEGLKPFQTFNDPLIEISL